MKKRISQQIEWVESPFCANLNLFVVWLLLMTMPDVYYWIVRGEWQPLPFFFARGILSAYGFTLIYQLIPKRTIRQIYMYAIYLLVFYFFVIDIFCITQLHDRYSYDMAAIILGTNINEAGEFLFTFMSFKLLLGFLVVFLLVIILHNLLKRIRYGLFMKRIGEMLLTLSLFFSFGNSYMLNGLFAKYHSFFEFPPIPDLKANEVDPQIVTTGLDRPENIVVIIGESFAKSHSSLYGYPKVVNPYLSALERDSFLYVYKNVEAPATHTLQAFHYILNTLQEDDDIGLFTQSITLPSVAKYAGYKTYWISNQSKHGQNDNIVGEFADLCDVEMFVANKFSGLQRWSLDGEVLPLVRECLNDTAQYKFFFVHLMGSHFSFSSRYPKAFDKFSGGGYFVYPEHQRKTLAEYDNSVLYNDFVVSNIMTQFKEKDAIAIYFADHGLDIYESSDDWCAHARDNDPVSEKIGRQIPFVIYASQMYNSKHHVVVERLRTHLDKDYCTDKLLYTIMDIMNVTFKNNDDVAKYSLLR